MLNCINANTNGIYEVRLTIDSPSQKPFIEKIENDSFVKGGILICKGLPLLDSNIDGVVYGVLCSSTRS